MNQQVLVSVVVPVYNGESSLPRLLEALSKQTYTNFEVIIADNNSTDKTAEIIQEHPMTKYVFQAKTGSYAARNAAIEIAKGEILAFTDDDCIPSPDWIFEGVESLKGDSVDFSGGGIKFIFSPNIKLVELLDSGQFLNQPDYLSRGFSVTANLFVKRKVFENIGVFDDFQLSGGDAEFCRRATSKGFKIVYAEKAIIYHPTRKNLKSLCKKAWRIGFGNGQHQALYLENKVLHSVISFQSLKPQVMSFARLRQLGIDLSVSQKLYCSFVNYFVVSLPRTIGGLAGYFSIKKSVARK